MIRPLTREITVKCIEQQRTDSNYQIGKIEALKMTDRIAQQYQIFIGSETLPRLSLRNKLDDAHDSHTYHLSVNIKSTGRIIVDLYSKHIRIELLNNVGQPTINEHDLYILMKLMYKLYWNVWLPMEKVVMFNYFN